MSTTLNELPWLPELESRQAVVRRSLNSVRARIRGQLWLEAAAWTIGALAVAAAATLAFDWLVRPSLPTRLVLLSACSIGVLAVLVRKAVLPLRLRLDTLDVATLLDRKHPGYSQRVATVLQLPSLVKDRVQASPGMVRAAVLADSDALGKIDLAACFDARRRSRFGAVLAAALLVPAAFAAISPTTARLWIDRWLRGSEIRWPQATYLALVGNEAGQPLLVPRGEPLTVQVDANVEFEARGEIWKVRGRDDVWRLPADALPTSDIPEQVAIEFRSASHPPRQGNFTHFSHSRFRYELPPIVEPTELHITGGDDWFGPVRVKPIDRPTVASLRLTAKPPGKSTGETQTFDGAESQLLFLPRTELELTITAREPLADATLACTVGTPPRLTRVDPRTFVARWSMREALALELQLVGVEGDIKSKPYFLSIGLLKDRLPRVTLSASGVGRRVTPVARLPLTLRALDDFGILVWHFDIEQAIPADEKIETKTSKLDLKSPAAPPVAEPPTEAEHRTTLQVSRFAAVPGTTLKLRGAATDNCAEGAQTGVSRWLTFQIVTSEELFYEILMRQRAQRARFRQATETAQATVESLKQVTAPEQALPLARKHQLMSRQVSEVARQLSASLEEMTLNELGSPQARELLATRIIAPLEQLQAELLPQQRTTLERLAGEASQLADHLADANRQQTQIAAEMDAVLKQMSQWESFVDVVNQLKEIIKLQNDVLDSTETERKKKTRDLFDD